MSDCELQNVGLSSKIIYQTTRPAQISIKSVSDAELSSIHCTTVFFKEINNYSYFIFSSVRYVSFINDRMKMPNFKQRVFLNSLRIVLSFVPN